VSFFIKKATPLELKIQSQTEKLIFVREFVSEAARKFGFDEETVSKIALAVDEACTNVIKHSYDYAPNREIEVLIKTKGTAFEVVIVHQGKSFDPAAVKSPDMKEYLSHFRRGGLGMHLMRSLMDDVAYTTAKDRRNEVHLVKRLPVNAAR
jgi:serine/threonine-protein kinase RsbW